MKFLKPTLLLAFVMIAFTSCEKLDELTEIDVNDTITQTVTVSVSGGTTFSESMTISVADPDVQDNIDKIQSVTVERLTYEITDVTGTEGVILNGAFKVNGGTLALTSIDLSASDNANTVTDITAQANLVQALASSIKNNATATLALDGSVSAEPVSFKIKIVADVKVTVDVL